MVARNSIDTLTDDPWIEIDPAPGWAVYPATERIVNGYVPFERSENVWVVPPPKLVLPASVTYQPVPGGSPLSMNVTE